MRKDSGIIMHYACTQHTLHDAVTAVAVVSYLYGEQIKIRIQKYRPAAGLEQGAGRDRLVNSDVHRPGPPAVTSDEREPAMDGRNSDADVPFSYDAVSGRARFAFAATLGHAAGSTRAGPPRCAVVTGLPRLRGVAARARPLHVSSRHQDWRRNMDGYLAQQVIHYLFGFAKGVQQIRWRWTDRSPNTIALHVCVT
jgi:hypothetical protein